MAAKTPQYKTNAKKSAYGEQQKANSQKKINKKTSLLTILILIAAAGCFHFFGCNENPIISELGGTDSVTVSFLNVDQGDSILIQAEEATVLIDGGETDQGSVVIEDLKQYGVTTIDYVIATHPHSDHIGGLIDVLNYAAAEDSGLTIKNVIMPELPDSEIPTTRTYEKFLTGVEANDIAPTMISEPQTISLGENTDMQLIPPAGTDYSSLNDFSLCTHLDCSGKTFFFSGDAEEDEETDLLESGWLAGLEADVFKAGHHGSRTSSTAELLAQLKPSYVVISCGADNSYGHPHEEAMERFEQYCDKIYRTDLDGTVICTVKDGELEWSFDK